MIGSDEIRREFVAMHTSEMADSVQAAQAYGGIFRLGYLASAAMHRLAAELYSSGMAEEADEVGDYALGLDQQIEQWRADHVEK